MKKFLQTGDIIRLEKGMKVYAKVPEKYVFSNRQFSDKLFNHDIRIGSVLHREQLSAEDIRNGICSKIKESLFPFGIEDIDDKILSFIDELSLDYEGSSFDTSKFIGEYVVTKTCIGGGGIQHTPNGYETYPDGYHVFCKKMDDSSIVVDFYQSGCFTAMIEDISPIKKTQ